MIATGTRLGPYEILAPAGAGGMGEVYKARDTRLDRVVAIKVLPQHLAHDPQLRERFEREARTVSALQHPNICVLFDIGEQEGLDFLVMEYLEGESLADRLAKGPLPADQAIRIASDVAEGLDRAHKHGIIHRDLKPGNIMLTKSGAKILDFGLAKGRSQAMAANAMTAMVTQTKPLTAEGSIVGTFQYMAPETLEGGEADARSDLFSLGAVMYEMLTGKRAFAGKTQASVIAAILASEPPPISAIQPMTPPALDRVVRTCLAKDPDERFQSAHDVVLQLRWVHDAGSSAEVPQPVRTRRKLRERALWAFAGAASLAAIILGVMYWHSLQQNPQVVRALLSDNSAERLLFTGDNAGPVMLSPDGKYAVYLAMDAAGRPMLWLRATSSLNGAPLPGTDDAKFQFWSSDSKSVAYFQGGKLKISDIAGNPAVTVADAPDARGGSWAPDGTILFAADTRTGISRVRVSGGGAEAVTQLDAGHTTHRWPQVLPDGKHFLYFAGDHNNLRSEASGIFWASLDGKQKQLVVRTYTGAQYVDGYLLYQREGSLLAQRFDPATGKLQGESQAVAQNVNFDITTWRGVFSASDTGLLVYQMGGGALGTKLAWFDRSGKMLGTVLGPAYIQDGRLSPDGKRVATTLGDAASDLWILDLERGTRNRLTFSGSPNVGEAWSPDGKQIVFMSGRAGHFNLYIKPADGGGEEQPLLPPSAADRILGEWTHDGKFVVYFEGNTSGEQDIWAVPVQGERKPFKVVATPTFDTDPVVSPDGKWIAYGSSLNGRNDIYVSRFPDGTGRWQISAAGGLAPRWSRDGKELFYMAPDRSLMRVPVGVNGNSFEPGPPTALFRSTAVSSPSYSYDPAPDGKRFLINSMDEQGSLPMVLVVNWKAELKK
ncbi:MAG TPA: protein kinase [Terriglobales bacterium]|nr:protein kinase [Terriglobales bacterium]